MGKASKMYYFIVWLVILISVAWWVALLCGLLHCVLSPFTPCFARQPHERDKAAPSHLFIHGQREILQESVYHNICMVTILTSVASYVSIVVYFKISIYLHALISRFVLYCSAISMHVHT